MTPRPSPFRPFLLALVLAVFALSGCSHFGKGKKKNAEEGMPVEQLYAKGHERLTSGNWSGAVATYRRLIAQYPYGNYTQQALMETAYAQFKSGNNDDAISSIDRYISTYPTDRNIAYLFYLRGLVNSNRDTVFLQKVWTLDASRRDLDTPMQAYNDFGRLVKNYPNSRYVEDARDRMQGLRNMFARHELDTALYYLRRGANVAAVDRVKYLLETFPQSAYQYDAVATLGEAYTRMGNKALADDARRVLQMNDPNHPWLQGDWPDFPSTFRKLNPFAGEKSPVDNDRVPEAQSDR